MEPTVDSASALRRLETQTWQQIARLFVIWDDRAREICVTGDTLGRPNAMLSKRESTAVLDRDFLDTRSRILEIAAALDRLDRAPRELPESTDRRLDQLRQAIKALLDSGPGRAEVIQRIFSLEYDPHWQGKNGSPTRRF
jgi:hypothetical protein